MLLRYLQGEQVPQERENFLSGAAFFEQARVLTPESLLLDARSSFCLGRVAIFDKDYSRAVDYLERAARLEPNRRLFLQCARYRAAGAISIRRRPSPPSKTPFSARSAGRILITI